MPETVGFMDASCRKCGRRIGWAGRAVDMPACSGCGAKPDSVALEHDQSLLDDFRELLEELKKRDPKRGTWTRARLAAGLSLGQAARVLGVERVTLGLLEQGEASPLPALAERMARCYSGETEG